MHTNKIKEEPNIIEVYDYAEICKKVFCYWHIKGQFQYCTFMMMNHSNLKPVWSNTIRAIRFLPEFANTFSLNIIQVASWKRNNHPSILGEGNVDKEMGFESPLYAVLYMNDSFLGYMNGSHITKPIQM